MYKGEIRSFQKEILQFKKIREKKNKGIKIEINGIRTKRNKRKCREKYCGKQLITFININIINQLNIVCV